jgi:hypothetical protein
MRKRAEMDNYYRRPSPQEQRYRDVLEAISALGSDASDLAKELDDVVWQVVRRAVDVAVADHDRRVLTSISRSARGEPASRNPDGSVDEEEIVGH